MIGWIGVLLGCSVPLWQIHKLRRTRSGGDIAVGTYVTLIIAMSCYLYEAIRIGSAVFVTAQSVNITLNSYVLYWLLKGRSEVNIKNINVWRLR